MRPALRLLRALRVLALESSADDSCCAIVSSDRKILSNVVLKQHHIHVKYGGIHPIKSQDAHTVAVPLAIKQALQESNLSINDIDAFAYTRGPGMYGCLSVSAHSAAALAAAHLKPIVGVHHMQAHALTPFLTESTPPEFPFLTLLVSGGHTLLLVARSETEFHMLAKSLDDSIGDAFDKTARLLQIPWIPNLGPGPSLESYALPHAPSQTLYNSIRPLPLPSHGKLEFSFAGLKSQTTRETSKHHPNLQGGKPMKEDLKRAMSRRFQEAAVGQLEEKVGLALVALQEGKIKGIEKGTKIRSLVVSGGVASNQYLRKRLAELLEKSNPEAPPRLICPPVELCTDNAAMIAWAGILKLQRRGWISDPLGEALKPKWALDQLHADETP